MTVLYLEQHSKNFFLRVFLSKTGLGSRSAHCKQAFHFHECQVGHLTVIGDVGSAWYLGLSWTLQDTQFPWPHPLKGVAPPSCDNPLQLQCLWSFQLVYCLTS